MADDYKARYRAYLKSPQWAAIRTRILARAQDRCEWCGYYCGKNPHPHRRDRDDPDQPGICGSDECEWCHVHVDDETGELRGHPVRVLDVHHKTYERVFRERDDDLVAICDSCHDGVTDRYLEMRAAEKAGIVPKGFATPENAATRWAEFIVMRLNWWEKHWKR